MTDVPQTAKQSKKDTKAPKVDQYADTKDPFVNLIYKKLRNKNKKLEKIKETEKKVKKGELKPNEEQLKMIGSKAVLENEIAEQLAIIKMYQEAFPDNPAFQQTGKKSDK
jgi:hypothetical protein